MSLRIRRTGSRSWLDHDGSRAKCAEFQQKLAERCQGEVGLFLTLTYDRTPYRTPRELYRSGSEEKHVALFMRRLGRAIGEKLTGRWICKLEFQRGGWVHFHIIVLGLNFIKHAKIRDAWGRGHVHVRKLTAKAAHYLSKYVAKDGDLPAFLLAEPLGSVKVVRTSQGFWSRGSVPSPPKPPSDSSEPPSFRIAAYRPIGESIERRDRRTTIESRGRFRQVNAPVEAVLYAQLAAGLRFVGRVGRWLHFAPPLGSGDAARRAAAADAAERLHLINSPNRDAPPDRPTWLRLAMTEIVGWQEAA